MRKGAVTNESADTRGQLANLYWDLDLRYDSRVMWRRVQRSHDFTLGLNGTAVLPRFRAGNVNFADPGGFRVLWVGLIFGVGRHSGVTTVCRRCRARSARRERRS